MKLQALAEQPLTAIQAKTWAQLRRRGRGDCSCLRKQSKKDRWRLKKSQRKAKKVAKRKSTRKSVFDVVALPEELEIGGRADGREKGMKSLMQKSRQMLSASGSRASSRSRSSRPNSRQSRRSNSSQKKAMRQQTDIERLSEIGINDPDSDQNSDDDEETIQKRQRRPDVVNKRLARGRHILFVGHIPKLKKTWKLRVNGTLVSLGQIS